MRFTGLCALMLALAPATIGCGDDIKFPDPPEVPDPALNGVFPPNGFLGRTIRVEVSGDATELTDAATVSFGAGITVDEVSLSSPSAMFATITIAANAQLGKRDVTVTDDANTFTLTAAFDVQDPLEILTAGDVEQGGFASVVIVNHDTANPFTPPVVITGAAGTTFLVDETLSGEFSLFATVLLDTDAPATSNVTVGDFLGTITQGGSFAIAARTAIPLTATGKGPPDFTATATLTGDTELFSVDTTALITAKVSTNDVDAVPFMVFLQDGKWANRRGFTDETLDFFDDSPGPLAATPTMFVVVIDNNAFDGYSFDLEVNELLPLPDATVLAETEPNDNDTTAQVSTTANTLFTGSLSAFDDVDFIKVSALADQDITAITTAGPNDFTDTFIEILDENLNSLGTSSDAGAHDEVTVTAPSDGDYYIVVSTNFFFDTDYELGISIN